MKRFWRDVTIDDARVVRLDDRPVRTPGRVPLTLPTDALARAVAEEWRGVGETIDPRAMPLTGLANAAIDRIAPDPTAFAAGLARYAESDLLCYRADVPEDLVARQQSAWDPVLDWARRRYDIHFTIVTGIMHAAQPTLTITRLSDAVVTRDAFALAGLSPLVTTTGSLVAALALAESAFPPDPLWQASQVDEAWQAERWGVDAEAERATAIRKADFDAGVAFLAAL